MCRIKQVNFDQCELWPRKTIKTEREKELQGLESPFEKHFYYYDVIANFTLQTLTKKCECIFGLC
jgi:hypothetical protein